MNYKKRTLSELILIINHPIDSICNEVCDEIDRREKEAWGPFSGYCQRHREFHKVKDKHLGVYCPTCIREDDEAEINKCGKHDYYYPADKVCHYCISSGLRINSGDYDTVCHPDAFGGEDYPEIKHPEEIEIPSPGCHSCAADKVVIEILKEENTKLAQRIAKLEGGLSKPELNCEHMTRKLVDSKWMCETCGELAGWDFSKMRGVEVDILKNMDEASEQVGREHQKELDKK